MSHISRIAICIHDWTGFIHLALTKRMTKTNLSTDSTHTAFRLLFFLENESTFVFKTKTNYIVVCFFVEIYLTWINGVWWCVDVIQLKNFIFLVISPCSVDVREFCEILLNFSYAFYAKIVHLVHLEIYILRCPYVGAKLCLIIHDALLRFIFILGVNFVVVTYMCMLCR